ncbi:MAG: lipid-A-disaccharide synthase [Saprospiraceae bacterium]|nr:lipid-A-disaccharide synthase [Saprospiraceae bacterium]
MKYYLIAGEASGDLHGANLMRALKERDQDAEFRFWGGDKMESAGGELVMHYRDIAYMGFVEVAKNLRAILRNLRFCKSDIEAFAPDALVLIDYPGFNMRIGAWARKHSLRAKICYYISPQVWAWKEKRAIKLKHIVDQMFVILPFEKAFYRRYSFDVTYVGHPLLDVLENQEPDQTFRSRYNLDERPIIALLPGSRRQEIRNHLSMMLGACRPFADYQIVIGGVSTVDPKEYKRMDHSHLIIDDTRALLSHARAAIVASGTATLETALLGVPQVICYKGSALSYQIAKRLIKVPYISLVNLILNREVVTELIQYDFTKAQLQRELEKILETDQAQPMMEAYQELFEKLGGPGASAKTAGAILSMLSS